MNAALPPTQIEAMAIGMRALMFLAGNPSLLQDFFDATGVRVEELMAGFSSPVVLATALDFILDDEKRTLAFASAIRVSSDAPRRARQLLPEAAIEL